MYVMIMFIIMYEDYVRAKWNYTLSKLQVKNNSFLSNYLLRKFDENDYIQNTLKIASFKSCKQISFLIKCKPQMCAKHIKHTLGILDTVKTCLAVITVAHDVPLKRLNSKQPAGM